MNDQGEQSDDLVAFMDKLRQITRKSGLIIISAEAIRELQVAASVGNLYRWWIVQTEPYPAMVAVEIDNYSQCGYYNIQSATQDLYLLEEQYPHKQFALVSMLHLPLSTGEDIPCQQHHGEK